MVFRIKLSSSNRRSNFHESMIKNDELTGIPPYIDINKAPPSGRGGKHRETKEKKTNSKRSKKFTIGYVTRIDKCEKYIGKG